MPVKMNFISTRKNFKISDTFSEGFIKTLCTFPIIFDYGRDYYAEVGDNHITITLCGISFKDKESGFYFLHTIGANLEKTCSPLMLVSVKIFDPVKEEHLFSLEEVKPKQSNNAFLLASRNIEAPKHYCCPLSGEAMDKPVFDIRSPDTLYDYKFLLHQLKQAPSSKIPQTDLLFNFCYLKVHNQMQLEINQYVTDKVKEAEKKALHLILEQCNLPASENCDLNQALRHAAVTCSPDDVRLLLELGAEVNSQANDAAQNTTALHQALAHNRIDNAVRLLHCGASIDIEDANGKTAMALIQVMPAVEVRDFIESTCKHLGLVAKDVDEWGDEATVVFNSAEKAPFVLSMQESEVVLRGNA